MDTRIRLREKYKQEIYSNTSLAQKKVSYDVFYPTKCSKQSTPLLRDIIHQIGSADFQDITQVITQITAEFEALNPPKLATFLPDLKKLLSEIKDITIVDGEKIIPSFKIPTFGRSSFQKLLDHISTFQEDVAFKGMGIELHTWLEGLHVHCSVNAKRQIIQKSLVNKDKLVDFPVPIKELNECKKSIKAPFAVLTQPQLKIAKGRADALNQIISMSTEETQTVLITILRNIAAILEGEKAHDASLQVMIDFIQGAIAKMWAATEVDYEGDTARLKYLAEKKDSIFDELEQLLSDTSYFRRRDSIALLSQELCLWMEGLFCYFYATSNFVKNGIIKNCTDGKIASAAHIGVYYYAFAAIITDILSKPENTVMLNTQTLNANPSDMAGGQVSMQEEQGQWKIVVMLPLSEKVHADLLYKMLQGMVAKPPVLTDVESISRALSENDNTSDENKIYGLSACAEKMVFSPILNEKLLKQFSPRIVTVIEKYIAGIQSYLNYKYLFTQNHINDGEVLLSLIRSSDDFKKHLIGVFSVREQLKKDGSGKLLPEIDRILLDIYSLLRGTKQYQAEPPLMTLMEGAHSSIFSRAGSATNLAIAAPSAKR